MYELIFNLGRYTCRDSNVKTTDLSHESLIRFAQEHIKKSGGKAEALKLSTQVVIWAGGPGVHNLLGVFDIRSEKLHLI